MSEADLNTLCDQIADEDPKTAMKAVQGLKALEGPESVDCIIAALDHPDENVRGIAAYALKDKNDPRAVPPLLILLERPDSTYLSHTGAMTTLGHLTTLIDDPEIVEQYLTTVRKLLREHDNYTVRGFSTQLLRDSLGEDSVPDLLVALNDEDHHVRGRAMNYLAEIWNETPDPLVKTEIKQAALHMINDPHGASRLRAAQALGTIGDRDAIRALVAALPNDHEETQQEILTILRGVDSPDAAAAVAAFGIEDPSNTEDDPFAALR